MGHGMTVFIELEGCRLL